MKSIKTRIKDIWSKNKFLIIGGIVITVGTITYLVLNNKNAKPIISDQKVFLNSSKPDINALNPTSDLSEITNNSPRVYSCGEYGVNGHIRNLPNGYTHSTANEALAIANGIDNLLPNHMGNKCMRWWMKDG